MSDATWQQISRPAKARGLGSVSGSRLPGFFLGGGGGGGLGGKVWCSVKIFVEDS